MHLLANPAARFMLSVIVKEELAIQKYSGPAIMKFEYNIRLQ